MPDTGPGAGIGAGTGPSQQALAQLVWGKAGLKSDPNVTPVYAVAGRLSDHCLH